MNIEQENGGENFDPTDGDLSHNQVGTPTGGQKDTYQ